MSISAKIRILLGLLCISLMFTAFVIGNSHTPQDDLSQSVKLLERNLHKKETWVNQLLQSNQYKQLKNIKYNGPEALKLIDDYTAGKRIWIVTLINGQVNFWSGIKVIPENAAQIKDGVSFIHQTNGYYEVIKKTENNGFSILCFIPVKNDYVLHNLYLNRNFDKEIYDDHNLEIADITDSHVQAVKSLNHAYLFSVKLYSHAQNHLFLGFEILLWAAGLLTLCLLVHLICQHYAYKKQVWLGIGLLALFIVVLRFVNLYFHYPAVFYQLRLFNPAYFNNNILFSSLGDLCLNILMLCWLSSFIYYYRQKLVSKPLPASISYLVLIAGLLFLVLLLSQLLNLFASLVIDTSINFDIDNILNLSDFSIIAVLMLCFCFLSVFLLTEAFLTVSNRLSINQNNKIYCLLGCIAIITAYSSWHHHVFTLLFILWSIPVLIRGYAALYEHGRINPFSYLSIVVAFSLIAAVKFISFQSSKERQLRKTLIHKLENTSDTTAIRLFKTIEQRIASDGIISDYFNQHQYSGDYLKVYFQSSYFDGYLASYNLKVNEFDAAGHPVSAGNQVALSDYKDLVINKSFKVTRYFYRENDAFGFHSYFAIIPVYQHDEFKGTVIIELKSKPLQFVFSFPQVLASNQPITSNEFKGYSYAFYMNNHLKSQNGKFVYDIINHEFEGKLKDYTFKNTGNNNNSKPWFDRLNSYSHLIYEPSPGRLIVVTREDNSIFESITVLTFFFIVLLTFSILVLIFIWVVARVKVVSIKDNHLVWRFKVKFNRILYQTRIQLFLIIAVVSTLLFVGIITYISIRSQYIDQQDATMGEKAIQVAAAFETSQSDKLQPSNEESRVMFNEFADNYSTDLALFDPDGVLLLTTQPKIYDEGLLARRINGRAYVQLYSLQKSVVVNDEKIGDLSYKAAYAPIRNSKNITIGYLQLPFFSDQADYRQRIGSLLNAMINIYALIFIIIGLIAVIIARQITAPLNFIQQSLRRTIYGQKNEPIAWERNDEIGALVREYNNMIAELDRSASQLAQSERESAWREMAKQVAHEIKNPLTPLKLGLQLLEKSWRDKDPRFDAKFERFSKSFVEQIESLSSIASAFSAFAKMPDVRLTRLDILEIMGQAVTIFNHMDNVKINYTPVPDEQFFITADRDQLLRCFNNLLKNAIEATLPDEIGLINITYKINNNSIVISIQDNGNGIPENMHKRIFEPSFTTKSSGTGLGLAFVKNSIENAGGKIWFETQLGMGTTFYLSFPKARA